MKSIEKLKELANDHPIIAMVSTGILTGGLIVYIPESIIAKAFNVDINKIKLN